MSWIGRRHRRGPGCGRLLQRPAVQQTGRHSLAPLHSAILSLAYSGTRSQSPRVSTPVNTRFRLASGLVSLSPSPSLTQSAHSGSAPGCSPRVKLVERAGRLGHLGAPGVPEPIHLCSLMNGARPCRQCSPVTLQPRGGQPLQHHTAMGICTIVLDSAGVPPLLPPLLKALLALQQLHCF